MHNCTTIVSRLNKYSTGASEQHSVIKLKFMQTLETNLKHFNYKSFNWNESFAWTFRNVLIELIKQFSTFVFRRNNSSRCDLNCHFRRKRLLIIPKWAFCVILFHFRFNWRCYFTTAKLPFRLYLIWLDKFALLISFHTPTNTCGEKGNRFWPHEIDSDNREIAKIYFYLVSTS